MKTPKNHPIAQLLRGAADGAVTDDELDALKLPESARRKVEQAVKQISTGERPGDRRALARAAADDVIAALGDAYAHPDYLDDTTDPAELAAAVPKSW